jgi:hypothetical protein
MWASSLKGSYAGIHCFREETAESDNLENRVEDVKLRLQSVKSRNSVVGIATGYGPDGRGV